jgi:hypothetical protein
MLFLRRDPDPCTRAASNATSGVAQSIGNREERRNDREPPGSASTSTATAAGATGRDGKSTTGGCLPARSRRPVGPDAMTRCSGDLDIRPG